MPLKCIIVTGELRNWQVDIDGWVVWGSIYNDLKERYKDGTYLHTSYITDVIEMEGGWLVMTKNSIYKCLEAHRRPVVTLF